MFRKIALILATAAVTVPVGTAVVSSAAGAATRTRPAVVTEHQRREKSEPASKDKFRENSSRDQTKDAHDSKDTTKDSTKDPGSRDPAATTGSMH